MKSRLIGSILSVATLAALSMSGSSALADTFQVSYLAPGVQSQTNTATNTYYSEGFDSGFTGTTTFGGSPYTGTYSGNYNITAASEFGGAGGVGNYIVTVGSTYTLTLDTQLNYFGFWLSAQDSGYILDFYNGGNLVYSFTPAQLFATLGNCSVPNPYCGNPNANFSGQDTAESFAFVNFFDATGTFDKIVFTETVAQNGYESDNHTVALLNAPPTGTLVTTPEPSSMILLGTGLFGVAGTMRRRFKK